MKRFNFFSCSGRRGLDDSKHGTDRSTRCLSGERGLGIFMVSMFFLLWGSLLSAQTTGPQFGGRFFLDFSSFSLDDSLEMRFPEQGTGGVEFRMISFHAKGKAGKNLSYKAQIAIQNGNIRLQDVYLKVRDLPGLGGALYLGHFPEPLTLSSQVSFNHAVFMERHAVSGYMPRRNTGLMYERLFLHEHLGLQAAVFFDTDGTTGKAMLINQNLHRNVRLSGLLIKRPEKQLWLLAGLAYSQRRPSKGNYTFRPTQSNHLEPKLLSYSVEQVQRVELPTAQLLLIAGPFSAQAEYVKGSIDKLDNPDLIAVPSFYGLLSFFLTGEHRRFKNLNAGLGHPKIKKPFDPKKGQWGAWEIAVRAEQSEIALSESDRTYLREYTMGLNVYFNSQFRLMLNYVLSDVNGRGREQAGMLRLQLNY